MVLAVSPYAVVGIVIVAIIAFVVGWLWYTLDDPYEDEETFRKFLDDIEEDGHNEWSPRNPYKETEYKSPRKFLDDIEEGSDDEFK